MSNSPLLPPGTDVRDLDGFMLNVEKLMASELVALSSHEVIGAALLLWCRAWKQVPAASLPDDDRVNAAFAKMPLPRFRKLKGDIMRGFVKCDDGRLYHKTLAEEARKAHDRKLVFQRKRETEAERLRNWRRTRIETPGETYDETRFVPEGQGQGQGQGQVRDREERKEEDSSLQGAVDAWNATADRAGLPKVQRLTEPRAKALRKRLDDCGGLPGWTAALTKLEASSFLTGRSGKDWRANFDFVLQPSSFQKLLEGAYDDRRSNGADLPDDKWQSRLETARRKRQWDERNWGPMPGQPHCRVPPHLLHVDDGNGWTIWQAEAAA